MGTEIFADHDKGTYVKRFYGGEKRGVCFAVDIKYREFTQKEMLEFLSEIIKNIIVKGEGINETTN